MIFIFEATKENVLAMKQALNNVTIDGYGNFSIAFSSAFQLLESVSTSPLPLCDFFIHASDLYEKRALCRPRAKNMQISMLRAIYGAIEFTPREHTTLAEN